MENYFFGPLITTTGLITGSDLIKNLKGKENLGTVLVCDAMLREQKDVFLDDLTPLDVEKEIGVRVKVIGSDANGLLDALFE